LDSHDGKDGGHGGHLTGHSGGGARKAPRAGERGRRSYSDAEVWEPRLYRTGVDQVDAGQPEGERPARPGPGNGNGPVAAGGSFDAAVRRAADIVLSLPLLAFILPLLLLTAALIRIDSRGPALNRRERVGLHGRRFTLLTFRSRHVGADARGLAWAARRDPRVTRVGAVIRLVRIDELPQLLNVLRGDMSFIGPRPERPDVVEQLQRVLPSYRDRALVRPGLTGWAQVNFPCGGSVEDARARLAHDLYYVQHRSLRLDLMILVATVRGVLLPAE
jgi:lipopolysaccharide/colanic/teichoic acid biosynthesis glycosyltransferase